jgi:hypothetical protein
MAAPNARSSGWFLASAGEVLQQVQEPLQAPAQGAQDLLPVGRLRARLADQLQQELTYCSKCSCSTA